MATSTSSEPVAPSPATVAIDTSVLLPIFEPLGARSPGAELLDSVRHGRLHAVISTIVASEVLVYPLRFRNRDRLEAIQTFLLTTPNVTLHPVDWLVGFNAARLRATHGIRLPDALIIASALACDAFASADRRALSVAEAEGIETMRL